MSRIPRAYLRFPLAEHGPIQVSTFELIRQPYAIDTARLVSISYSKFLLDQLEPSSPIVFSWGSGTQPQTMYGYVHSIRPMSDALTRGTEIVVSGVQAPLATFRRTRAFRNMGPHNVAAQVVDDYRLRLHSKPFTAVNDYEQDNINDWQFLSDVARDVGYVLLTRGTEILFVPLMWYWERQMRHQSLGLTFRNTMTRGANIASFDRDEAEFRPALIDKTSPFGTSGDFTRQTDKFWQGQVTGDLLRALFPQTAKAKLLGPRDVYPLDMFTITTDTDRLSWTVLQVVYRLTTEDYYATVHFGGNGRLYPSRVSPVDYDVSSALEFQELEPQAPRLMNFMPVYAGAHQHFAAHWEAGRVHSPETEEALWLR